MGKKTGVKYFKKELEEAVGIEKLTDKRKNPVLSKKNDKKGISVVSKPMMGKKPSVQQQSVKGKGAQGKVNIQKKMAAFNDDDDDEDDEEDDDEEEEDFEEEDGEEEEEEGDLEGDEENGEDSIQVRGEEEDDEDEELQKEIMALQSLAQERINASLNKANLSGELANSEISRFNPVSRPVKKSFVPSKDQIQETLAKIKEIVPTKVPWIERLDTVSSKPITLQNVEDDFKRELAFYEQALEAVSIGKKQVLASGVPFDRPEDYFAEMIKDDQHMLKVRQRLIDESQRIKKSEDAAKTRMLKKYAKKVQTEKLQQKEKAKSEAIEKIKMLRKGKKNIAMGGEKDDEFNIAVENELADKKGNSQKQKQQGKKDKEKERGGHKSAKRQQKDQKFGAGGKKRGSKSNTRESTDFFGSEKREKLEKMRKKNAFSKKAGKGGKVTKNRPGKSRRQNSKGK